MDTSLCDTFVMSGFRASNFTVQLLFNSFCKKRDVMDIYHLGALDNYAPRFKESGRAAILG